MPLPLPNLDTRRWADLVDEARGLIPRFSRAWTDHNIHDPGITIIDMLAAIVEADVYRLNRVPEEHQRKFLALAGFPPGPPRAAFALLQIMPPAPVEVPEGQEFGASPTGNPIRFRAVENLQVVDTRVDALFVEQSEGSGRKDVTNLLRERGSVALLGDDPAPGSALWLRFDKPLPTGVKLSLGFAFSGGRSGQDERLRIIDEAALQASCQSPLPPLECDGKGETPVPSPPTNAGPLLHHSVRLEWSYFTTSGSWRVLQPGKGEIADDTRAFTLDGTVAVLLPEDMGPLDGSFILRARLSSGDYDTPPMLRGVFLNALKVEQAVQPLPDDTIIVDGNTFAVSLLGSSDGRPNQAFSVGPAQVKGGSLRVFTREPDPGGGTDTWHTWDARPDLDASRGTDLHLVVVESRARISFGDGNQARIPPSGSQVFASYLATEAERGNVRAGEITAVLPRDKNDDVSRFGGVANPFPAAGGATVETVSQAAARAVAYLLRPSRAITVEDYEMLALETPGTAIARAHALPGVYPAFPCMSAPGVVTILVVPDQHRAEPVPSPGLLDAVRNYLERRRVLGTHLEVVCPRYVRVSVTARVKLLPGADGERARSDIVAALDTFLHPITGGPAAAPSSGRSTGRTPLTGSLSSQPPLANSSQPAPGVTLLATSQTLQPGSPAAMPPAIAPGWPFGRDVYRSEVLQVIDGVPGVDSVLSLEISGDGGPAQCGNLCVGPIQLVVSGTHSVEVG